MLLTLDRRLFENDVHAGLYLTCTFHVLRRYEFSRSRHILSNTDECRR